MSVTPLRPTSSAGQSTRRVSFSPVVREVLDVPEKHRGTPLHPSPVAECSEETARDDVNAEVPSTTSHRTRLNAHSGPARSSPDRRPSVAESTGTTAATFMATPTTTTTTTLEFSLKDIPLDGKMAPPVWREPSPGRSHSSRRASPARGGSTASSARFSHTNTMTVDAPSPANTSRNPYADAARDNTNMLRRQRVVRTFFDSHEDAVRLYIRLQQLLSFRDVCHREFQQRLQYMNSDEERQRAVAARAQRMAAQEQEIQRIQAALARADVSSPEFASSMNSLYSTRSGTPTEKSAKRDGEVKSRVNPSAERGTATVHTASKAASIDSPRSSPRPGSNTKSKETGAGRGGQRERPVAAARPPPSPRHATPKAALEAWRGSRSQEMPPPSPSPASASLHDGPDGPPRHRGFTPKDSLLASNMAPPPPSAAGARAAIVTLVAVHHGPPPPPRRVVPFSNSSSDVVPLPAAPAALVPSSVTLQSSFSSSLLPTTAQSSAGDAAKAVVRPGTTHPTRTAALLPAPTSSPGAVVGMLVTPPRSARTAQLPTALSPSRITPKRYAAGPSPSSTDSPLARFRKQQGYEDPVQHYRARLSSNTTPLRSMSSMGSARRSPPPPLPAQHGKSLLVGDVAVAAPYEPAEDRTTVAPANASPMPAGPGTALLRAARAAVPSSRTALPLETAKKPIVESTGATSVPRSPSSSPLSPERRAAILQRASQRRASPSITASADGAVVKASGARPVAAATAAAAVATPADIRSWSPASPPEHGIPSHNDLESSDSRRSATAHAGLVSSTAKSLQSSREASLHDAAPQAPRGTASASANIAAPAFASAGHSVWDDIAALERRVGGLEGRTAELERNAAKRAVLDAIRLLRERVTLLEDRTTVLEQGSGDDGGEDVAGALQLRRS